MTVILTIGIVLAEIFTPQLDRLMFDRFSPAEFALCVHITRILLPAQLFFYVGGAASAVLLARRIFLIPPIGPLFSTARIILRRLLFSPSLLISPFSPRA